MRSNIDELYSVIASLDDEEKCKAFFSDLCTENELINMSQRLEAARLLMSGETYEEVIKKTEISSATLSRVSKCVKYGEGYKNLLK